MSEPIQLTFDFIPPDPDQLSFHFFYPGDDWRSLLDEATAGAVWFQWLQAKLLRLLEAAPVDQKQSDLAGRLGCTVQQLWATRKVLKAAGKTNERQSRFIIIALAPKPKPTLAAVG